MKSMIICQLLRTGNKHDWDYHILVKNFDSNKYRCLHDSSMNPETNNQFWLEFIL